MTKSKRFLPYEYSRLWWANKDTRDLLLHLIGIAFCIIMGKLISNSCYVRFVQCIVWPQVSFKWKALKLCKFGLDYYGLRKNPCKIDEFSIVRSVLFHLSDCDLIWFIICLWMAGTFGNVSMWEVQWWIWNLRWEINLFMQFITVIHYICKLDKIDNWWKSKELLNRELFKCIHNRNVS